MRSLLLIALLVASMATGCGRIGYTPFSDAGAGGASGTGAGGTGSASGGAGGSSSGGASGSAGGASGSAGGVSGSAGGVSGSSGAAGGGTGRGGASGATGGAAGSATGRGGASGGMGGSAVGGTGGAAGGRGGAGGGTGGAGGGAGGAVIGGGGTTGASCPVDTFGGHTYAFCEGPLAWPDAQTDCMAKGMRLVRIDDSTENAWVQSIAFAGISSVSSVYWPWIGATDATVSGEWRWTDGALFWLGNMNGVAQGGLYVNWVAASPGNGTRSECGILESSAFWKDWPCSTAERYVCEQY
jgi:Lectin C-type domain